MMAIIFGLIYITELHLLIGVDGKIARTMTINLRAHKGCQCVAYFDSLSEVLVYCFHDTKII